MKGSFNMNTEELNNKKVETQEQHMMKLYMKLFALCMTESMSSTKKGPTQEPKYGYFVGLNESRIYKIGEEGFEKEITSNGENRTSKRTPNEFFVDFTYGLEHGHVGPGRNFEDYVEEEWGKINNPHNEQDKKRSVAYHNMFDHEQVKQFGEVAQQYVNQAIKDNLKEGIQIDLTSLIQGINRIISNERSGYMGSNKERRTRQAQAEQTI